MFNKFKKNKISIPLFILSSILSLTLLLLFFILTRFYWVNNNEYKLKKITDYSAETSQNFDDPFITKGSAITNKIISPVLNDQDPTFGKNGSPITIFLYSDFTCAACKNQEKIIKELLNLYPNKISVVWKDYPNQDKNSLSYRAALAARCAEEQNNFWFYHDLLFEKNKLGASDFTLLAKQAHLNTEQFFSCLSRLKTAIKVDANIKEANDLELPGVPFLYLNKQEFLGLTTSEELIAALEKELKIEN
jgi:protein-disulfide isomerase